jgi:hypothetical protein
MLTTSGIAQCRFKYLAARPELLEGQWQIFHNLPDNSVERDLWRERRGLCSELLGEALGSEQPRVGAR